MAVKGTIPSLPPIPTKDLPAGLGPFLSAVRDIVQVRAGQSKNTYEYSPTVQNLIDNGVVRVKRNSNNNTTNNWELALPIEDPADAEVSYTQLPWLETFADNNLTRFKRDWSGVLFGPAEETIVAETGTPPAIGGKYVLQMGNNSGTDTDGRYLNRDRAIPIETSVLYKATFHARKVLGTGTLTLGIMGVGADRTAWVNTAGTNATTTHYEICLSAVTPGSTAWVTYVGYFKRDGGAYAAGTPAADVTPCNLHANALFVVPFFKANSATAGTTQIGYVAIERVQQEFRLATRADSIKAPGTALVGYGVDANIYTQIEPRRTVTTDETRTSTTTLTDSTTLKFDSVVANSIWEVDIIAKFNCTDVAADLKFALNGPTSTTMDGYWVALNTTVVEDGNKTFTGLGTSINCTLDNTDIVLHIKAFVVCSTTVGNIAFQFAQQTSSATALTLKKGSSMRASMMNNI